MAGLWLGIETTSPRGGVALVRDDTIVDEEFFPVMATHSEKLLPGIDRIIESNGITGSEIRGIGVSAGPGSYTGLRIGLATAMGLAAGWNTGVVAVGTLRILAAGLKRRVPVLACIRARKDEVFAAAYESGDWDSRVLVEPGVYRIQSLMRRIGDIHGLTAVGNGQRSAVLPQGVMGTGEELDQPKPSLAAILAQRIHTFRGFDEAPCPIYLRGFNQKAKSNVP